tara:strand:+ start:2737 stop:3474 length:738 start_codon:yes stop_codon:yes gene_type:complete
MSNEDNNASADRSLDGQPNDAGVGQDEGTIQQENSTTDWEAQAKYHQSEKDKLYAENQKLKEYEKVGKFLESRPDLVKNLVSEVGGQSNPQANKVALKPDEFDPWEAYNDPSSKSYKFRMQEMQETINGAVDNAVGGIQAQQGRANLRSDLATRGLNEEQIDSFFEFADKHPSEYGIDNVLKMWQAVSQPTQAGQRENPLDQVRQTQANPQAAGVLQGQQPERKNEAEQTWEGVLKANRVGNRIP